MLDILVRALELLGAGVIVIGFVFAAGVFVYDLVKRRAPNDTFRRLRGNLGRGILVGLEVLVGADIVATISAPLTLESVLLLGGVVLIRTFLSFSLEIEIEGCFPWRRRQTERGA